MLGKNEPIEGINLEFEFQQLIGELPWNSLLGFLQTNAPLFRMVTSGGYRIGPKWRDRIAKVIFREAKKSEYAPAFTNGAFAQWYPLQSEIHDRMESYFHSDEYKKHREDNKLGEDIYVLPDEKFDEFICFGKNSQWRVLLIFSPLEFTPEQAERILKPADSPVTEEISSEKVRELEEALKAMTRERDAAIKTAERAAEDADTSTSALQELKREKREMTSELRSMEQRFEASQNENKKLRSEIESINKSLKEKGAQLENKMESENQRLLKEMENLRAEVVDWRSRYEVERASTRKHNEEKQQTARFIKELEQKIVQLNKKIEQLNSFAELILENIDWPKVGGQMKMTPALKRQFNNLIRNLDYEENKTLTIEGTLPDFWERLMGREKLLIEAIAKSNTAEVQNSNVEAFWQELVDDFEDVRISLEARSVLIKLLEEIFFQTLEMSDLEKPRIPKKS